MLRKRVAKCAKKLQKRSCDVEKVAKSKRCKKCEKNDDKPVHRTTCWRRKSGLSGQKQRDLIVLDETIRAAATALANQTQPRGRKKRVIGAQEVKDALSRAFGVDLPYTKIHRSFTRVFDGSRPTRAKKKGSENEEDTTENYCVLR